MTEKIEREIREWLETAEDLGKMGVLAGESSSDPQRKKLSYCIAREILMQCQEIRDTAGELLRSMGDILEYLEESADDPQKVKTKQRR